MVKLFPELEVNVPRFVCEIDGVVWTSEIGKWIVLIFAFLGFLFTIQKFFNIFRDPNFKKYE